MRAGRLLAGRYSSKPVALLRIVLGLVAFVRAFEGFRVLWPLTDPAVVQVPFVMWSPRPTALVLALLLGVWAVSAALFAIGWQTRSAGVALTLSLAGALFIDQQGYSNHLYLLTVLVGLLTLAGAGAAFSLDAAHGGGVETVERWPVLLMKLQVTVVYLFAALTKLNAAFLGGAVLRAQLGAGLVPVPDELPSGVVTFIAVAAVVIEFAIAAYLWHPRRRWVAVGAGVLLHGAITLLMAPFLQLLVFTAIMWASYLLFIPAEPGSRSVRSPEPFRQTLRRLDVLGVFALEAGAKLKTSRDDHHTEGWRALVEVLDEIPVFFLVAPFLRLPLLRTMAGRMSNLEPAPS